MIRVLLVGAGDVARRVVPLLAGRFRLYAAVRSAERAAQWRALGVTPVLADLDQPRSLQRLAGLAQWVIHLAPPPAQGPFDPRTAALLAALARAESLPRRLIYISTTGVYGDLQGAWADEVASARPAASRSDRACRRADAEARLRRAGRNGSAGKICILRAPGIYAADRLPVDRIRRGEPALRREDDAWSNHIHADDLARIIVAALRHGRCNRAYNAVDDEPLRMGDYFDAVADRFALPRQPRLSAAEARARVSPAMWSYMAESRQLSNRRLRRELHYRFIYPTVRESLRTMPVEENP